jgi:hypothetical protein
MSVPACMDFVQAGGKDRVKAIHRRVSDFPVFVAISAFFFKEAP